MITGENPIAISNLNDFIFCPVSIYFNSIDSDAERLTFQDHYQLNGTAAHQKSDKGEYSDRKDILQAIPVYCEKYNIYGKIDIFDIKTGKLTERKKKIKAIYDGYIFQVYAQYFALTEMGYKVNKIIIYSMDDNKPYPIPLPHEFPMMLDRFEKLIVSVNSFRINDFIQENKYKCLQCIYEPLCSFSLLIEEG